MRFVFITILIGLLSSVSFGQAFSEGFEADSLPAGWTRTGDVAIDAGGFAGQKSLRIRRELKDASSPVNASLSPFEVKPGIWDVSVAVKAAMQSPDTSYTGVVDFEVYDAAGKTIEKKNLIELGGDANWKPVNQRIEIPEKAAKAAFKVRLEKAIGSFYIDDLSAKFIADAPTRDTRIDRVMFIAANPTGLLLPTDSREFTLRVETTKPLDNAQLEVAWSLTDYFGAEQIAPAKATLSRESKPGEKNRTVYSTKIDVAKAPLEPGRYYELHAAIPQTGEEPYREFGSFAILPEAAANQYKPEEVLFHGRSWDNRSKEHVILSRRLGIRIIGLRTEWSADSATAKAMPHTDLVEQMPATWLGRSPNFAIEHHLGEWQKYTDEVLRGMIRDYAEKYKRDFPTYMSLGNEPNANPAQVKANIAAYKATYEEFKKSAPNVYCVGTAVGPEEVYFKEGFGAYCDAYDYHTYGSYKNHRTIVAKYRALFQKYGHEKPIWVTETGLNAQGMTRLAIAQEVPKHFAIMFAEGVANGSWFGTCFPDPDGTIEGSNGDSFNLFRGKYKVFTPRLDAIAYYNTINSIGNKKFVQEKLYDNNITAVLFTNADGKNCQILWTEKGRLDIGVPLAGVGKVKLTTLEGRVTEIDAGGKAVSVSVSEDPIFLEYEGTAKLAEKMDSPAVNVLSIPKSVVKGVASSVVLSGDGEVSAPPFWTVTRSDMPGSMTITPPANSTAREGVISVKVPNGELSFRVPVSGKIASELLPIAATPEQPAAVRLVLANRGGDSQKVAWKLSLEDQAVPTSGMYDKTDASTAYFAKTAEGTAEVAAGSATEIVVPIASSDPVNRYRIKAVLKDGEGRTTVIERYVGGFAGVPKTAAAPKLDGVIDDTAWTKSAVQVVDRANQYNSFKKPASKWDNAADLSAKLRFAWDDQHLYIAAEVADDVYRNINDDEQLWSGDGLQLLVDAARESAEKPGKYDYVIANGAKGPQAWCALSADSGAPLGEAKNIQVAVKKGDAGNITYEIAIPWSRVAPFKPAVGENLGLAVGVNEDDGQGRNGLMSWFGNVHSKQLDSVGDLILLD
jgi:hypothetical protein